MPCSLPCSGEFVPANLSCPRTDRPVRHDADRVRSTNLPQAPTLNLLKEIDWQDRRRDVREAIPAANDRHNPSVAGLRWIRRCRRLARSGELLRAGRGVYVLPVKGKFGARAPAVAKVVQEWASQRGETVVGSGAAAHWRGWGPRAPRRHLASSSESCRRRNCWPSRTHVRAYPPGLPARSARW